MKTIIDNRLLKLLGSHESIKITNKARLKRNRLFLFLKKVVDTISVVARNRFTFTCEYTENLPGKLLLKENDTNTDNLEALAAHKNIGIAYDFYNKVLKLNSVDNKGLPLISSVNYSVGYDNAYWSGSQMVCGSGSAFKPLGNSLDVICHELGHGVTQFVGPNLVYFYDSGALNEAYSDIFGICAKHWVIANDDPATANWLIGDEIVTSRFPGKAIRSFKDEQAYDGDNQPKFRMNYVWTLNDNGGVHTNSGIVNHLFYRICLNMKSPSYLQPLQLFWSTYTKLKAYSDFNDFKSKLIASSAEMFGVKDNKHLIVLSTLKELHF